MPVTTRSMVRKRLPLIMPVTTSSMVRKRLQTSSKIATSVVKEPESNEEEATKFEFSKLPIEIRFMIWDIVCSFRNYIKIDTESLWTQLRPENYETPSVLQVSHESRKIALKHYRRDKWELYFVRYSPFINEKQDILIFPRKLDEIADGFDTCRGRTHPHIAIGDIDSQNYWEIFWKKMLNKRMVRTISFNKMGPKVVKTGTEKIRQIFEKACDAEEKIAKKSGKRFKRPVLTFMTAEELGGSASSFGWKVVTPSEEL